MNAVGWIDTGKEAHYQLDPSVTFPLDGSEEAASAHQRLQAQPDPHDPAMLDVRRRLVMEAIGREKIDELNDWVGDQLQRVYRPGG